MKQRYWLLSLAMLFFCLDYYYRISPSLFVSQLMSQFSISAVGVAVFASIFFFGYLLVQIPAGRLLEKYSLKYTLFLTMLLCPLSYLLFLSFSNLLVAYSFRFINGITAAFSFIATLYIAKHYFDKKWFGFISGLAIAVGTLVSSGLQIISSILMASLSWRMPIILFSICGILLSFGFLFFKTNKTTETNQEEKVTAWLQVKYFFQNKYLIINSLIGGIFYLPASIYDALWGIPFMEKFYHLSTIAAASGITVKFAGDTIGSLLFGYLSIYVRKTTAIINIAAIAALIVTTFLVYVNVQSVIYVYSLLLLFGLFAGAQVLVWRIFIELCDIKISTMGVAITNVLIMGIISAFHFVVGVLLNSTHHAINYKLGLSIMPISFIVTFLLCYFGLGKK
jgi:MFS family permease